MSIARKQELLDAKLAHYNAFMRTRKNLTDIYGGFPDQAELDVLSGVCDHVVIAAPKAERKAAPAKARVRATDGTSKIVRARELYAAATDKSRATIVELFISELSMTKSGAMTYFYNVQR